jgi:hypothetical protein
VRQGDLPGVSHLPPARAADTAAVPHRPLQDRDTHAGSAGAGDADPDPHADSPGAGDADADPDTHADSPGAGDADPDPDTHADSADAPDDATLDATVEPARDSTHDAAHDRAVDATHADSYADTDRAAGGRRAEPDADTRGGGAASLDGDRSRRGPGCARALRTGLRDFGASRGDPEDPLRHFATRVIVTTLRMPCLGDTHERSQREWEDVRFGRYSGS